MPAEGPNPPLFNELAQGALTLAQAEAVLDVDHFNWLQQVTYTPPTLQPVTLVNYNYESTLLKLTGNQLEYVLPPGQSGNYTLDASNPLAPLTPLSSPGSSGWASRSAPLVDPIVPKAGFEYTQQYLRGFIINGEYAYIWPMNGTVSTATPPPPDGFFYYYNEPSNSDTPPSLQALTSQYDTLTPNTTEYSLLNSTTGLSSRPLSIPLTLPPRFPLSRRTQRTVIWVLVPVSWASLTTRLHRIMRRGPIMATRRISIGRAIQYLRPLM